jgi:hypothetical protein
MVLTAIALGTPFAGFAPSAMATTATATYSEAAAVHRADALGCHGPGSANPDDPVPIGIWHADGFNEVLVGVCVAGRGPFPFLIDSGAEVSVISQSLARSLRLSLTGDPVTIAAIGCNEQASDVTIRSWSMGGIELADQSLVELNFPAALRRDVDGVIGSDVLARFGAIRIDYRAQELALERNEAPPFLIVISTKKPTKVPTVPALLDDTSPTPIPLSVIESPLQVSVTTVVYLHGLPELFAVDTGASISIVTKALSSGLTPVGRDFEGESAGCNVGGPEVQSGAWSAGAVRLTPQALGVVELPASLFVMGLLGSDVFFEKGILVIDYQNARMYLGDENARV